MNEERTAPATDSAQANAASKAVEAIFEFESMYANNTRLEQSVWDLKILFGELEQHTGKEAVRWHTAITLPWMQAKLLCYFLQSNLTFYELSGQPLWVNPNVVPPKPEPPTAEQLQHFPKAQQLYEALSNLHAKMFGQGQS